MDDDDEDEDEDGDGDPDAPPAPAAPLLLTSASSTSASHCWPQPPPTSTAEKWASGSASRVTSGNRAEAARQPLQGFGTSRGNEHMQVRFIANGTAPSLLCVLGEYSGEDIKVYH
ncbi:uncharacterized protein LJ206_018188 isoform 1-T3 [Theristicus caerulescens]